MSAATWDAPIPGRCFCQIAMDDLIGWARKRFLEGLSTVQLLATAKNPQEREAVGIVALLDVSDEELARVLSPLRASDCNVLACREHVRKWLGEMLHSQN
jgi:hypothetical protein